MVLVFYAQLECTVGPVADEDTRQCKVLLTDITRRKLAEEQITSFSKIPTENPSPVLRIRKDGIIIYANDSSKHLLKEWSSRVGEGIPEDLKQAFTSSHGTQTANEIEITSDCRTFSFLVVPVPGTNYVNMYGMDITERKLAEKGTQEALKKVREFQQNLEAIFENIKDGIILLDSEQRIVEFNDSARRICGLPDINTAKGKKFENS
jgi:PAS fold.